MQKRFSRGRVMAIALVALAIGTPASAQFGGLKKKLKGTAAQEGANKAAESAGGTIVLTEDVVARLIAGLKAGRAERDAAAKEDTPFGRYKKAEAAFAVAEPKCQAAQQSFPQRMANDEKTMNKYSALVDKMVAAQTKGDQKLTKIYQDSAMAMQDPSCTVERPSQPDDYYEAQRTIGSRAEQQEMKASGFSRSELAMVKERTDAILRKAAPDASASEKSAVDAKGSELKPLLGIDDQPPARATKPAPAPAPAPAAPAAPAQSPAVSSMNECMMKNMQAHQKEIEGLGKRAEAAQKANDTDKVMAIADTLQQLQMAGCR
jgi:hypothetical protein